MRHASDACWYRDKAAYSRDEVAYKDSLPAMPLEDITRFVKVRLLHQHEPPEPPDEPSHALLADPEPREV